MEPSSNQSVVELKSVDSNVRYASAWNEINVRIAQRQSIINFYTTLTLTAIGAGFSLDSDAWRIIYAIPPLSLLFILLIDMHERQIAILRSFLCNLEHINSLTTNVTDFYHKGSKLQKVAGKVRVTHDFVCIGLMIGFFIVGSVIFSYKFRYDSMHSFWDGGAVLTSIIFLIFSLIRGISIQKFRNQIFLDITEK